MADTGNTTPVSNTVVANTTPGGVLGTVEADLTNPSWLKKHWVLVAIGVVVVIGLIHIIF